MDLTIVFKASNLLVGGFSLLGGFTQLFSGFQSFLLGLFLTVSGIGIIGLEFQVPPQTYEFASFLFSFLGRGVYYLLLGSLLLHGSIFRFFAGFIIFVVGVIYSSLHFIPSIDTPENMKRDNGFEDLEDGEF